VTSPKSADRELGEVRVEIKQLQSDVSDIKATQQELRDVLIGAKGSWKTLTIAATIIVAVITGLITTIAGKFTGG